MRGRGAWPSSTNDSIAVALPVTPCDLLPGVVYRGLMCAGRGSLIATRRPSLPSWAQGRWAKGVAGRLPQPDKV